MEASKEQADACLQNLEANRAFMDERAYAILHDFLEAARKRLPSAGAIAADKQRKRDSRRKATS